jgi:MAM domain.
VLADKLPSYSHCTFEEDLCGWTEKQMTWTRQNGSHGNGPSEDHTYQNASGQFLYHFMDPLSLFFYKVKNFMSLIVHCSTLIVVAVFYTANTENLLVCSNILSEGDISQIK